MSPSPFIIYTNKDNAGWVRFVPDSLDSEDGDLVRMTLEDLTSRSKAGNRQLCVISPMLALAVMKPVRAAEGIKAGVKLQESSNLKHTDPVNKTHESFALAPMGGGLIQMILQSKKRELDNFSRATGWRQVLSAIYEVSQSGLTGDKKVIAILDIGPVSDSEGRCYEIVFDWDGDTMNGICEHVRALKRLCGV